MSPPIAVIGAAVSFGAERVLSDVDLTVPDGEFLALLGANGSGKSTLLRAMLGLQPLASGAIELFGRPVASFRGWRRVAYVPQHLVGAGAVPVSVSEVVSSGLPARRPWHRRTANRNAVCEALAHVGLRERRSDSFHTLSGGQQRRVMIAAALAKQADLVLLDEPTAGVDEEHVLALVAILRGLSRQGVTIVLVTHELGPLADLVTRCVVLRQGPGPTVRYDGPPPPPRALRDPHGHVEETAPPADRPWWEARP